MKFARYFGLSAFAAVALLLNVSQSQGASLAVLVGPPPTSLSVPPLTFSNFTFSSANIPFNPATLITAASINVNALPAPQLGISITGPFNSVPNTAVSNDVAISFSVTGAPITSVGLFADGSVTGSGFFAVTESVFSGATFLGKLIVQSGGSSTATLNLGGSFSNLTIFKDIAYGIDGGGGTQFLSIVNQTFTTAVPEPASVVMMGLGVAGVLGVARFRRKAVVA